MQELPETNLLMFERHWYKPVFKYISTKENPFTFVVSIIYTGGALKNRKDLQVNFIQMISTLVVFAKLVLSQLFSSKTKTSKKFETLEKTKAK